MLMDLQHGDGHAALTWSFSMDMVMQHGHGHAACTWTCSTNVDINPRYGQQHGQGYAARTGICSTDMDMQHGHVAWTQKLKHRHGHAASSLPSVLSSLPGVRGAQRGASERRRLGGVRGRAHSRGARSGGFKGLQEQAPVLKLPASTVMYAKNQNSNTKFEQQDMGMT